MQTISDLIVTHVVVAIMFMVGLVLIIGMLISFRQTKTSGFKQEEAPFWEKALSKEVFTDEELQDMYDRSLTLGKCATGEIFGELKRLKGELSPPDYQQVEAVHKEFGQAIAIMYMADRAEELTAARQWALESFKKLRELRGVFNQRYIAPYAAVMMM